MGPPVSATPPGIQALRGGLVLLSAVASVWAAGLFLAHFGPGPYPALEVFRAVLVSISVFWLAWGSLIGCLGLIHAPHRGSRPESIGGAPALTAVLVPVYNEDPVATLSRVAAMNASLVELGAEQDFHFAVLSDSTDPDILALEAFWFQRLLVECGAVGRMFYRRRPANTGKKAGNIEDFVRRSGSAYDYAVILDADSLLDGETLCEMVRRMQAEPRLGLLQTLPEIIGAQSVFGRAMQFAAGYYSPAFARGSALLQGAEGPFWGHNAIVRMRAFAGSCGLPELSGKPPSGGHILSHDYVEAALLARAGWMVRLDPDIGGSFEEGPENLIAYAKRDRRWCQGNLQHRRLLAAPGLRWWNRFTFLQGIMAYLASPIWLAFLIASIGAATLDRHRPAMPTETSEGGALTLLLIIVLMLVVPKLVIFLHGVVTGENRRFGGSLRVALSALLEVAFTTAIAPIMLLYQSRAVAEVLFGLDGGWPATRRGQSRVELDEAWAASSWIVAVGVCILVAGMAFAPEGVLWVLPAVAPMIAAPVLIALSSRAFPHALRPFLLANATELSAPTIVLERERILSRWLIGIGADSEAPGLDLGLARPVKAA